MTYDPNVPPKNPPRVPENIIPNEEDKFSKYKQGEGFFKKAEGDIKELYYIQIANVFHGNACVWWGSRGMSADIEDAGKYNKKEARSISKSKKKQHYECIIYPCSYIDGNTEAKKVIIDSQYLDKSKSVNF